MFTGQIRSSFFGHLNNPRRGLLWVYYLFNSHKNDIRVLKLTYSYSQMPGEGKTKLTKLLKLKVYYIILTSYEKGSADFV